MHNCKTHHDNKRQPENPKRTFTPKCVCIIKNAETGRWGWCAPGRVRGRRPCGPALISDVIKWQFMITWGLAGRSRSLSLSCGNIYNAATDARVLSIRFNTGVTTLIPWTCTWKSCVCVFGGCMAFLGFFGSVFGAVLRWFGKKFHGMLIWFVL